MIVEQMKKEEQINFLSALLEVCATDIEQEQTNEETKDRLTRMSEDIRQDLIELGA